MPGKIYLWGSGGGASEILHLIEDLNRHGGNFCLAGMVGRGERPPRADLAKLAYIDSARDGWESTLALPAAAVVTVGQPCLRETLWREIRRLGLPCPALVHPSAVVSPTARLASGCIVGPNATISAAAELGENVYVSFNASIGHDCRLGAHSVLSPGARLGGGVAAGARLFVGLGGIIIPGVAAGDDASVAAGALLTGSLRDGSRAVPLRSRVLGRTAFSRAGR